MSGLASSARWRPASMYQGARPPGLRAGWIGLAVCALAMFGLAAPLHAQTGAQVQAGVVYEGFTFGQGLGFDALRELTVPVVATFPLGGRADLTLASGFASVEMDLASGVTRSLSGLLDTEARFAFTLVEDRLRLLLSGSVPTGIGSVAEEEVVLLGGLSNDLLALATPSLGGGGSVGAGLAGASTAGSSSVGYAMNVRVPLTYQPILGSGDEVRAGTDVRVRVGLESPVGRRGLFRAATIASIRGKDELNGARVNGVGSRIAGYASLAAPLGSTVVTVWGSGFYRSDPALEATAVGAAFVPRGTLLSAGLRLTMALGAVLRFEPEVEFRTASAAPDAAGLQLEQLGDVIRFGARLIRPLGMGLSVVAHGEGLSGTIHDGLASASTTGFRASVLLEWNR